MEHEVVFRHPFLIMNDVKSVHWPKRIKLLQNIEPGSLSPEVLNFYEFFSVLLFSFHFLWQRFLHRIHVPNRHLHHSTLSYKDKIFFFVKLRIFIRPLVNKTTALCNYMNDKWLLQLKILNLSISKPNDLSGEKIHWLNCWDWLQKKDFASKHKISSFSVMWSILICTVKKSTHPDWYMLRDIDHASRFDGTPKDSSWGDFPSKSPNSLGISPTLPVSFQ